MIMQKGQMYKGFMDALKNEYAKHIIEFTKDEPTSLSR